LIARKYTFSYRIVSDDSAVVGCFVAFVGIRMLVVPWYGRQR